MEKLKICTLEYKRLHKIEKKKRTKNQNKLQKKWGHKKCNFLFFNIFFFICQTKFWCFHSFHICCKKPFQIKNIFVSKSQFQSSSESPLCGLLYVLSGHQSLWMPCYTERFLPCVESHMSCQSPGHNIVLLVSLGVSGKWVWEAST